MPNIIPKQHFDVDLYVGNGGGQIIGNGMGSNPSPTFDIARSLKFKAASSNYLSRTTTSYVADRRTWTMSMWVKRGVTGAGTFNQLFGAYVDSANYSYASFEDGIIRWSDNDTPTATNTTLLQTTRVCNDTSRWYHLVFIQDTNNATAADRRRIYVDGERITSFSSQTNPVQYYQGHINRQDIPHRVGSLNGSNCFDGYMSTVHFIDGYALDPSYFGFTDATYEKWMPKAYTGPLGGRNSYFLKMSDNSSLAALSKDTSGNLNDFTQNGTFTLATDSVLDTPTNNYNTFCSSIKGTNITFSEGNTKVTKGTSSTQEGSFTNFVLQPNSGKFYSEIKLLAKTVSDPANYSFRVMVSELKNHALTATNAFPSSYASFSSGGTDSFLDYRINAVQLASVSTGAGNIIAVNDTVGVAIDTYSGTIYWYRNNTLVTSVKTTLQNFVISVSNDGTSNANTSQLNSGQYGFTYTPPAGYVAVCSKNVPYNINATAPDLIILKDRTTANNWQWVDSLRGKYQYLQSNLTNAEAYQDVIVTNFKRNGFEISNNTSCNAAGDRYVAYKFYAKERNVAIAANAYGAGIPSIPSVVTRNTEAGFSIVTYTGTTGNQKIGHGLGKAPQFVIVKPRGSGSWIVYHTGLGSATKYTVLNQTTDPYTAEPTVWNSAAPDNNVFNIGTATGVNTNLALYVAYCFAEVPGFSKFGSYAGNGSTDGPFVYCGFRPKFIMVKRIDTIGSWVLHDSTRDNYNSASNIEIYPGQSDVESANGGGQDFLSNGFKQRSAASDYNTTGGTYIYAAFAENPINSKFYSSVTAR